MRDQDAAEHWRDVLDTLGIEKGLPLLDEYLDPQPDRPKLPTVRDIVEDYIDHHSGLGPGQRGKSRVEAERDIYPTLGDLHIDQLDAGVGEDWIRAVRKVGSEPSRAAFQRSEPPYGV
jgi:hypothetical protein